MSRSRDRLLLLAAAATGAGLVGGGLREGVREFLHRQGAVARGVIGKQFGEVAPQSDRTYKKRYGARLELLLLGDSIAAGLGADLPKETLGARLAAGLAKQTQRSVRLVTAARVGSESSMLAGQLAGLPEGYCPDVAVIVVGGNDVTHRVPVADSVRHLEEAIVALRERGAAVVVGTCPDLGALRPVPQPLRALGSHPSAVGYKRTAKAMLSSVLAALGMADQVPYGHRAPSPEAPSGSARVSATPLDPDAIQ